MAFIIFKMSANLTLMGMVLFLSWKQRKRAEGYAMQPGYMKACIESMKASRWFLYGAMAFAVAFLANVIELLKWLR